MYNIAYITDENYALPTKVSLNSLIKNSGDAEIAVHIVSVGISDASRRVFEGMQTERVSVSVVEAKNTFPDMAASHPYVSKAALQKFCLPLIFGDLDRLLYLDGDTILLPGFLEIFKADIGDAYVAAAVDQQAMCIYRQHEVLGLNRYFNSGVMLMNLAKMREDMTFEKLVNYKSHNLQDRFMEQDSLNVVFGGDVTYIGLKYNRLALIGLFDSEKDALSFLNATHEDLVNPVIIHYAGGEKPWNSHKAPFVETWMRYVPREDLYTVAKNQLESLSGEIDLKTKIREGEIERPYLFGSNMVLPTTDGVRLEGFHYPEEDVRWTSGPAKIHVSSEDFLNLAGDIRLHLRLRSFHEDRKATVRFNGKIIFEGQVRCSPPSTNVEATIVRSAVEGFNTIEIVPDGEVFSPAELGMSFDDRKLALGVEFAKIQENTSRRFAPLENLVAQLDARAAELDAKTSWIDRTIVKNEAETVAKISELDAAMTELRYELFAMREEISAVKDSTSYKVGKAVTFIPRKIRRWFS